jgi:hypothetical protein
MVMSGTAIQVPAPRAARSARTLVIQTRAGARAAFALFARERRVAACGTLERALFAPQPHTPPHDVQNSNQEENSEGQQVCGVDVHAHIIGRPGFYITFDSHFFTSWHKNSPQSARSE